ncbi:MAG: c-type cytochrome biogenesis protein CcmI [Methylococcales bacterium]|nr:c-type cytochrome biogenesis protein CcmI [Methylococcales bacterium]
MMNLWLIIALLLGVAVIILIFPLLKSRQSKILLSDKQQNINIFKERLSELEQEKAQNNLDEATFLQLKLELEKSLLSDVKDDTEKTLNEISVTSTHWVVSAVISFLVIGASLGIYNKLGRSEDYALSLITPVQAETKPQTADEKAAPNFDKMTAMLEAKLKQDPTDLQKWFLLANTYSVTGNFNGAAKAYASALTQMPKDDPNLAAVTGSYAQMLFQGAGEVITPETQTAITAALTLDPKESSALILKGIQAYMEKDLTGAIAIWEQAKEKASPQVLKRFLEPTIAQTKINLSGKATAPTQIATTTEKPAKPPKTENTESAKITIKLDLQADLKAKTKPDDIIFIFAQKEGSRMPLAAERLLVKDLPKMIILDDSKSPMPTAKLSSQEFVNITARVSFSKQPMASTGDFFTSQNHVAVKASSVLKMTIDQVKK